MGWTLENNLPDSFRHNKYQVVIYNGKNEIVKLMRTDVKECVKILESEAIYYISRLSSSNPSEIYTFKTELRREGRNDQSL